MSNPGPTVPAAPFLVVGLNPTFQKTIVVDRLRTGEVNRATGVYDDVAGKGLNVARVLGQLGDDALHVTHVGGPETERFLEACDQAGLQIERVDGGTGIRTCVTVVDRSGATATELVEPAPPVGDRTATAIVAAVERNQPRYRTLVIAGSSAPGYPEDLPARLTALARRAGLSVVCDYRGAELQHTLNNPQDELPSIVKINLAEFAATFFHGGTAALPEETADEEVIRKAAVHMRALQKKGIVPVITRGSQPVLMLDDAGEVHPVPPVPLEAVNPIGSGDAFTAGLLHHLAAGASLLEAVEGAHAVAAMNASNIHPGSIRPERGER